MSANPHAGLPIRDDDATIARMLEDVSVPTLMRALVHMMGDAKYIRGAIEPQGLFLNEVQGFMPPEMQAEARRQALLVQELGRPHLHARAVAPRRLLDLDARAETRGPRAALKGTR